MFNRIRGYYFITDSDLSRKGNVCDVKAAIRAGARIIQYRNKCASTAQMYKEASILRKLCKGKAIFLINDRIDIAQAVNADGVHIGQEDLPFKSARYLLGSSRIIGVTVHDTEEAISAQRLGADYIGLAPIFKTSTKPDSGCACGIEMLKRVRKKVSLPLVAIGGIDFSRAKQAVDAGADAICAISAVVKAKDVKKEIEKFQALFD
jgi:thiamine-phosphate pyrophosphorylase